MTAIRVFLNAQKTWVAETNQEQHPVQILGVDNAHVFRSLGLHPEGGLCIKVDNNGIIEEVTLHTGVPIVEFHIPANHGLANSVQIG